MPILSIPAMPPPADPPPPGPISVEEFLARYAGRRVELVNGFVKETPMPFQDHGVVCLRIGARVLQFVEDHDLGRVSSNDSFVKVGADTIRGGDVCFFSFDRVPRGPMPPGLLDAVPELVVEVRSPSDLWTEMFAKADEYLAAGVSVVVILDPGSATASVHRPGASQTVFDAADTLTLDDVLPGFSVPVARLFA